MLKPYLDNIAKSHPELVKAITEKPFTVVETDVHPKLVADWNKCGLLLAPRVERKHHRLSASEFLWIKMIEKLRQFSVSYAVIGKLKDELVTPLEFGVTDIIDDAQIMDVAIKVLGEQNRSIIEQGLADPKIRAEITSKFGKSAPALNYLDIIVLITLVTKQPISLILDEEEDVLIYSPIFFQTPLADEFLSHLMHSTHLSISINALLAQVLTLAPIDKVSEKLSLVTEAEAKVLEGLREQNLSSVRIRFDNDGEMDLLELTKKEKVDERARLMELLLTKGYQQLVVNTQEGKVVHFENTRKLKLK
jgi:DNA-binding transcriptional MerR regulator